MAHESIAWAENMPASIKSWVTEFFSAADGKGPDSASKFSKLFSETATMEGMNGSIRGRQAIYESRLHAWNAVETRKHVVDKVYGLGADAGDILILGRLESALKNGRSFEMEFAAQVIFVTPIRDRPEAESYRIWADRRIALDAAKEA